MRTTKGLIIFIFIATLTPKTWGQGQANCDTLIQQGLYDTYSQSTSSSSYSQMISNFCGSYSQYLNNQNSSSSSSDHSDADSTISGSSHSVGGSVSILGFGGGGSYSSSNMNGQSTAAANANSDSLSTGQIQAIAGFLCNGTNDAQASSGALQELSSVVDPGVLAAYNDCLAQSEAGLQVSTTVQEDQGQVTITMYYLPPVGAPDQIMIENITIAPSSSWNCSGPLWSLIQDASSSANLANDALGMTCVRTISPIDFVYQNQSVYAESSSITIFTSAGTVLRSFTPIYASLTMDEVSVLEQQVNTLSAQIVNVQNNLTTQVVQEGDLQNNLTAQVAAQEEQIAKLKQVTGTNIQETCSDFNFYCANSTLAIFSATCQSASMGNITNYLQLFNCPGFNALLTNHIFAEASAMNLFSDPDFVTWVMWTGQQAQCPSNVTLVNTTLTGAFQCTDCFKNYWTEDVASDFTDQVLGDLFNDNEPLSIDLSSFLMNRDGILVCAF